MYKTIIFDFNGTLLDDCVLCLDILNILTKEKNLKEVSMEEYRSIFTFPVYLYYKQLGFDVSYDSFKKVGDSFIFTIIIDLIVNVSYLMMLKNYYYF